MKIRRDKKTDAFKRMAIPAAFAVIWLVLCMCCIGTIFRTLSQSSHEQPGLQGSTVTNSGSLAHGSRDNHRRLAKHDERIVQSPPKKHPAMLGSANAAANQDQGSVPAVEDNRQLGQDEHAHNIASSKKPKPNRNLASSCSVKGDILELGDGSCNPTGGYNTAACGYDGGDCCASTCVQTNQGNTCVTDGNDSDCQQTDLPISVGGCTGDPSVVLLTDNPGFETDTTGWNPLKSGRITGISNCDEGAMKMYSDEWQQGSETRYFFLTQRKNVNIAVNENSDIRVGANAYVLGSDLLVRARGRLTFNDGTVTLTTLSFPGATGPGDLSWSGKEGQIEIKWDGKDTGTIIPNDLAITELLVTSFADCPSRDPQQCPLAVVDDIGIVQVN